MDATCLSCYISCYKGSNVGKCLGNENVTKNICIVAGVWNFWIVIKGTTSKLLNSTKLIPCLVSFKAILSLRKGKLRTIV